MCRQNNVWKSVAKTAIQLHGPTVGNRPRGSCSAPNLYLRFLLFII